MKKKITALVLILTMTLAGSQMAFADKLSDAKQNLANVNNDISYIESQQAALQKEINQVDSELVSILVDIDVVEADIENNKVQLAQAEADLVEAQATEEEQYASMKERIRYMYENGGGTSLMDALIGAEDFADVLNKVENFTKVYDADRSLLVEYQNTKIQVENLIMEVEAERAELDYQQQILEDEKKELERVKARKSAEMADFDSKLAEAERLASQYKATIAEQNRILAARAAQSNRVNGTVSAGATSVGGGGGGTSSGGGGGSSSGGGGGVSSSAGAGGGSSTGASAANYACNFIGNPYVWGGTSLTNGADCSGFVMSVYSHYGVSLPHSSSALRGVGTAVSVDNMAPGDIVCYSGHVGIYIGGGQIVNASNSAPYPSGGIKVQSAYYKSILAVRRVV